MFCVACCMINMKLTKQQIEHIANLARLELSEAELDKYGSQLSGILSYIDQLKEINTENIEPTAQVTGLQNVLRDDAVEAWDEDEVEDALKLAPEIENRQFKVRRVLN